MITLYGIYDDGKILLDDKNPPHIKAKVEIKIFSDSFEVNEKVDHLDFHKSNGILLIQDLSRESLYDDEIS